MQILRSKKLDLGEVENHDSVPSGYGKGNRNFGIQEHLRVELGAEKWGPGEAGEVVGRNFAVGGETLQPTSRGLIRKHLTKTARLLSATCRFFFVARSEKVGYSNKCFDKSTTFFGNILLKLMKSCRRHADDRSVNTASEQTFWKTAWRRRLLVF